MNVYATFVEPALQKVRLRSVKTYVSSVSSYIADQPGLVLHSIEFNLKERTSVFLPMEHFLRVDSIPEQTIVNKVDHVDILWHIFLAMLHGRVETTNSTFASESHHVGWGLAVPILMSPVLSTCSHTGFGLIYDKYNTLVFGHRLNFLIESGSSDLVSIRTYWLNYDSTNGSVSLRDKIFDLFNTPVFFLKVGSFVWS